MNTLSLMLVLPWLAAAGDTLDVPPLDGFDLYSIVALPPDTIYIVSCDDFLFSPFGEMTSKRDLKDSPLKGFKVRSVRTRQRNGIFEMQYLQFGSSELVFFFDENPEGQRGSYVMRGDIQDSSVLLGRHVRVGMAKRQFVDSFFASFPVSELARSRIFVLDTCLGDVRHVYTFESDRLVRIRFEQPDTYWKF